jgi:hypothetical protein
MRHQRLLTSTLALAVTVSLSGPGRVAPRPLADEAWFARGLAEREYRASHGDRGLQAPNRAHGLRIYFTPDGIRVHEREGEGSELVRLDLAGFGRGDALDRVGAGEVTQDGSRVELRREGLVEWFQNSPAGLEQGFTLATRPPGAGDLVVELDVHAESAALRGDRVVLAAATGRRLEYGHLHAVDATGRALASRFELASPTRVRLAVDDLGAAYPVVIDPLLTATADTRLEGNQQGAYFGGSVAAAGDVNGDGYADVIVGAPRYDAGQTDEGAAFLFLGGAAGVADGGPASAAAQIEADQADALLGSSVAGADVNGDGYGDVIVAAPDYGQANAGATFVFLGSATGIADGNPASAAARLDQLGAGAAAAGDVNGDGFADVIASGAGGVALFHGSATGIANGTPATAATRLASVGSVVAGAGDVNGDGYDDVIIGAPDYGWYSAYAGVAYLFAGSASGIPDGDPTTAMATIESDQANAYLGTSVAGAGDVNRDGYADVIVGAPNYDHGETDEGAAFVFLGSASGIASGNPASATAMLESDRESARLGTGVAGAGDLNGDGFDDVIAGAPHYDSDPQTLGTGAAFVFVGSAGGLVGSTPATAAVEFGASETWYGGLASSVAGAGDVNGDGYDDVIVGEPTWVTDAERGRVMVLHGGPLIGVVSRLASGQAGGHFGMTVAGAGDVNGDGFDDVIVGAPWYDAGQTDEGAAFVFLGSAVGVRSGNLETAAARLESDQAGAQLGSVAGAGDVNGDGYDDVIVAAWGYDSGQTNEGAAFVFLGSATGIADGNPATAATQIETNWELDGVFGSVASAGDVNGDGYGDVVVGAWGQKYVEPDLTRRSAALIYHGSATGIADGSPDTADTRIETSGFHHFGYSLAGAGDVNGDGYDDVIVGDGLSERAYIYLGRAGGIPDGAPETAATTISSSYSTTCSLGSSVSGAGDVNGDGFDDVIVGAPCMDDYYPQPRSAAFVFHGSASGIASGSEASAATRLSADQKRARMGGSVAGAGDVNGDGYDDVIVGAGQYNHVITQAPYGDEAGAAFVFAGSASGVATGGPATAAIEIAPGHAGAWLGWSVAGAGDVNGDGGPDLIVGAPGCVGCPPADAGMALIVLPEPSFAIALAGGIGVLDALARRRRLTMRRAAGNAPCR